MRAKRREICRGRASFNSRPLFVHTIDNTCPTSTCDDGELELYASEMGVLSKAKLAAKRLALKGVPKSIRELPLGEAEAAARKPILVSRTKEIRSPGKRDERRGNRK